MVVLLAGVCIGCVPRVRLPEPPPRDAPIAERNQAYLDLAPVGRVDLVMTKNGGEIARWVQHLELGNGLRVAHPADLLPAVLPGSPTAQQAARFSDHRTRHSISVLVASSIVAVGLGVLTGYLFGRVDRASVAPYVGFGMLFVGGLSYAWTIVESALSNNARGAAFGSFPRDLAERLGFSPPPLP
ncbi:MAG: hypothetical protein Q8L48_11085 [Archangium sp.]|nr:hypothetical protein [Archangium sp.]